MKHKNGFLTFCFAFCPGAGQMYLGYMKRGLTLIGLFCLSIWMTSILNTLMIFLPIVWMFSFFDTFNLRSQILDGCAPQDDYLFHLGFADSSFTRLLKVRHHFVGWALVAIGVYALYENFLHSVLWRLRNIAYLSWMYDLLDHLPTLLVCIALIWVGLWLVRGPRRGGAAADDEIHYYEGTAREAAPDVAAAAAAASAPMNDADKAPRDDAEQAILDLLNKNGEVK